MSLATFQKGAITISMLLLVVVVVVVVEEVYALDHVVFDSKISGCNFWTPLFWWSAFEVSCLAMNAIQTRDLLLERQHQQPTPIGAGIKRKSAYPVSLIEHLTAQPATPLPAACLGIAVSVTDDCFDYVKETGDEWMMQCVSALPGLYWYIGTLNEKQCFRQQKVECDAPNDNMLFCFFGSLTDRHGHLLEGWFWSTHLFDDIDGMEAATIVAFSKEFANADVPSRVWVPYTRPTAPRSLEGVNVETYFDFVKRVYIQDQKHKTAVLEAQVELLQSTLDGIEEEKAERKQQNKGQHGGALPRTAKLIAAYYAKDWGQCQKLCDEAYSRSEKIKELVDMHNRGGRAQFKGKGYGKKGRW